MVALAFLAVAGLLLTALLFVADATIEKNSSPAIVTSQRTGLPEPQYHHATRTLTTAPAPAPDMTSPAVLAAQPKSEPEHAQPKSELEHNVTIPVEARAPRAEAAPKKARVEAQARKARAEPPSPDTRPDAYHQTPFFDKFSIKDY